MGCSVRTPSPARLHKERKTADHGACCRGTVFPHIPQVHPAGSSILCIGSEFGAPCMEGGHADTGDRVGSHVCVHSWSFILRGQGFKAPKCPRGCTRSVAGSRCSYLQVSAIKGQVPKGATFVFTLVRSSAAPALSRSRAIRELTGLHAACGPSRQWRSASLRHVRRVGHIRTLSSWSPWPRGTPHPETFPSPLAHNMRDWSRDGKRTGEFSVRSGYLRVGLAPLD